MQNNDDCNDKYMIVPNKFINKDDLSNEEIIDICDLNKNKDYCKELREKLSKNKQKSVFKKPFSYIYWRNRIFRFKMVKILKIKPYEFSKGGF